jgi:hypothetical protein
MKALAVAMSLAVSLPAFAAPEEIGYGMWLEQYKVNYRYFVDTKAQICLALYVIGNGAGSTTIDCASLKRRPEWQPIITWVDAKP